MSHSMHNKIHLGRSSIQRSRILHRVVLVSAIVGIAGVWAALSGWR